MSKYLRTQRQRSIFSLGIAGVVIVLPIAIYFPRVLIVLAGFAILGVCSWAIGVWVEKGDKE